MPKIRGKQIYADTAPIYPYDVVNKEYVDTLFSGATSGSTLTVQDEGVLVSSNVNVINFIGSSVKAKLGSGRVDIYIPSPNYASNFNQSGGTTDASVTSNLSPVSRYIATPAAEGTPYYIGGWSGGTTHPTIRNSVGTLTYTTIQEFSVFDSGSTTFTAELLNANGVADYTHSIILSGTGSTTANGITINVTSWVQDADRYKAVLTVSIAISGLISQGGRFSVRLTHDNSIDGVYTYTSSDIFRDRELNNANLTSSSLLISEGTTVVTKFISGVKMYDINTQWHVRVDNINNLNSNTYPTSQQLTIDQSNLFISSSLNVHGQTGLGYDTFTSGWTNLYNSTGAAYEKFNWTTNIVDQTNINSITGTLSQCTITGRIFDWVQVDSKTSVGYNFLIDTFQDLSTRNTELFTSEDNSSFYRLNNDCITQWDNTASLSANTGLQILGGRLVYPKFDFTSFNPSPSTQPDYSSLTGDRNYYRAFTTNDSNVSNGIIVFTDHNITESDLLSNDVRFRISKDSGATWYTLNSPYIGGVLVNGSGCRVDSLDYGLGSGFINNSALKFTLGSGGFTKNLILEITFTYSARNRYIGKIEFTDSNW